MADLEILKQNREALLLAEAIGWLHDYRKCSEEHLRTLAASPQGQGIPRPELANRNPSLDTLSVSFAQPINVSRSVANLLNDRTWHTDVLGQYLSRCHNTAHFDKQEPGDGKQNYPGTQMSSPFGFETNVATNLTNSLWGLPWADFSIVARRETLRRSISALFSTTVADSRRPINEVDLWSWGEFVGALYKSALAGALLTGTTPQVSNLRWRLLGIRVNGLDYISNVDRIPDLLARQDLLTDALDKTRKLLEAAYPLGSEVYRDQNGSLYVVPDVSNLLALQDTNGTSLETLVHRAFDQGTVKNDPGLRLDGEVLPTLILEPQSWWGQDPNWPNSSQDELPGIGQMLAKSITTTASVNAVEGYWQGAQGKQLCPVCRLRPMAEGQEACKTCLGRRASRIETWLQNPAQTIWMDELADHNNRVALLVGRFGLDDWLSGDLVQTMLVRAAANNPAGCTPKNPSPARLRRVWATCQRFWTETVQNEILARHEYGKGTDGANLRCVRQLVIPDKKTGWQENIPYDGTIDGKPISLLWREEAKHFVTISNLQKAGTIENGQTVVVSDPDNPRHSITFTVQGVMQAMNGMGTYSPYLSLLASPDQFLALVPAHDALEIAEKIRQEYQKQFGKVQNRLPLFLGLVFFLRKMPLAAVMDAGKRMLDSPLGWEQWTVQGVAGDRLRFDNGVGWAVPTKMGDGITDDMWYPYYFVENVDAGKHKYRFQLRKQGDSDPQKVGAVSEKYADKWLVHIGDLQPGDEVSVTPSRFAYLWLESTAQRFQFDPQKDVLLLDELPRLMAMWEKLKGSGITNTALHGVWALLEAKARAWGINSPEFAHLAETTLVDAQLSGIVTPDDVIHGRFFRCLDLYVRILKQKIDRNDRRQKMSNDQKPQLPESLRYFALALDPIHVGTGGMRLGRVDMSIVREPGTNLPKLPGTSLAGACRTYAAMQEDGKFPRCAGQGQADTKRNYQGHCGQYDCPICVTFGFARGEGGSFQGLAQFSDARLVFFPVHSLAGPVWVTCPSVLKDLGVTEAEPADGEVRVAEGVKVSGRLNLGWLMLTVKKDGGLNLDAGKFPGVPQEILQRAVLVSDKMFGHIVNDNLEVRTSVSIDPQTGAAAEGALYTYEALPRSSVLMFEVVVSDPRFYRMDNQEPLRGDINQVKKTVENGLRLFETLGIGGMGTRGMGRLRVLNLQAGGGQ